MITMTQANESQEQDVSMMMEHELEKLMEPPRTTYTYVLYSPSLEILKRLHNILSCLPEVVPNLKLD